MRRNAESDGGRKKEGNKDKKEKQLEGENKSEAGGREGEMRCQRE